MVRIWSYVFISITALFLAGCPDGGGGSETELAANSTETKRAMSAQ